MANNKKRSQPEAQREQVAHSAQTDADYYTGTQAALIAGRICKAHWFPAKLALDTRYDPPRTKRTYMVEGHKPETILTHRVNADGKPYWIVKVAITEAESKRRHDERERRQREREEEWARRRQATEQARGGQPSAPVLPGSDAPAEHRAAFDVGDRVIVFQPGFEDHNEGATITQPYGWHDVDSGGKTEKRWGYVARLTSGESRGKSYFFPAGNLREFIEKPFHLRAVREAEESDADEFASALSETTGEIEGLLAKAPPERRARLEKIVAELRGVTEAKEG